MSPVDALEMIRYFYPDDTPLRRLLWKHSSQVREKARKILQNPNCPALRIDLSLVDAGALLHDIGIGKCHAPGILCEGTEPYIAHGVIGGAMLRKYAAEHGLDWEPLARICERHTGSGITAEEVCSQGLPIPVRDYLPESPEEKLICLADKFFSKSGDGKEKTLHHARHSLEKFGADSVERFQNLCRFFGI